MTFKRMIPSYSEIHPFNSVPRETDKEEPTQRVETLEEVTQQDESIIQVQTSSTEKEKKILDDQATDRDKDTSRAKNYDLPLSQ